MNVIFWWYVTLDRSSFCEPKNLDLVAMATSYRHFCLPRPQTMNYHNSAVFHAIVFKFYTITHIYHLFRFLGSNGCHGNQKKHLILARLWFWVFLHGYHGNAPWQRPKIVWTKLTNVIWTFTILYIYIIIDHIVFINRKPRGGPRRPPPCRLGVNSQDFMILR